MSQRFNLTPWMTTRSTSSKAVPERMFASSGATNQEGSKPIFTCDCGANLVWVKSQRTGKNYLAECFPYANGDAWYYRKDVFHSQEKHDERIANRTAYSEQAEASERALAFTRRVQQAKKSGATDEEITAIINEWEG
jgi:hypothetical protein